MDADLDLLLTTVFVTADALLPEAAKNVARRITDAEVVTLCVAQTIMEIPSDRRFLAVAEKRLGHLFPRLPQQPGYFKRRRRLAETLEWLMGAFASHSPGSEDDLLLIDSTPVECYRSRETVKRAGHSQLDGAIADAGDTGIARRIPGTSMGWDCMRSSRRTEPRARWSCAAPTVLTIASYSLCPRRCYR